MKLKKHLVILMSFCALGLGIIPGCGSSEEPEDEAGTEFENVKESEEYFFEAGGVRIAVDGDMAPVAKALGEPDGYFEQPSCAAQGIAKFYTYSGFEVETYPDGDKDLVARITLKDDTVATPEGVDLSKTREDILETYGSDFQELAQAIIYEKNGAKLCFVMRGDDIVSIEYDSAVMN